MASIFYDQESGFKLEFHFEPIHENVQAVFEAQKPKVDAALELISRMERGEIVNHTSVKAESEDRFVDHYNHRMDEELVPGRSLAHTIKLWNEVKEFANAVMNGTIKPTGAQRYETIIFNGIGGSYLGPLMLIIAKYGMDFNTTANLPVKIYFISNTDADMYHHITESINIGTSIMVHLSKSGSTSETAGNMQTWCELCRQKNLVVGEHNAAVTIKDSQLDRQAVTEKFIKSWHMETETGGRTSVCSAIGMVPLAFAKMDFEAFIRGMGYMDKLTRRKEENPAAMIASIIDASNKKVGFKNMIVLCYSEFMREYSHYLQQLYMESLGKEYTVEGNPAKVGQTVFGGVGTGEQHSFMQQVQKGLGDCFVRLVYFENREHDFVNKQAGSMGRQLLAFLKGTEKALMKNNRPFITSTFSKRREFEFGMMIALEERIVTFLASFMNINAYDQPGVQDGKLAASDVNKVSAKIVEALTKITTPISGTTKQILEQLGMTEVPFESEAILHDIYANHSVAGAYEGLENLKAERAWDAQHHHFTFTFSK